MEYQFLMKKLKNLQILKFMIIIKVNLMQLKSQQRLYVQYYELIK